MNLDLVTADVAIKELREQLYREGRVVKQEHWQSSISPDDTWEMIQAELKFMIPHTLNKLADSVKPNLPWAEDQFQERIGGEPVNPGVTFKDWPHYSRTSYKDDTHRSKERFSHTYMERFWPKTIYHDTGHGNGRFKTKRGGIRFHYGDYEDVKNLLANDLTTRQAFLPIFHPEDTGCVHGQRIPCSLGYDFIIRDNIVHLSYYMRSCDYLRHLRDDVYMACRLVFDIIDHLRKENPTVLYLPGNFNMYIKSLHVFKNEKELLKQSNK